MNRHPIAALCLVLLLAGCADDEFADLRVFMEAAGKDGREKIEPLPQVRQVATFEYRQGDLIDPFLARNLRPTVGKGGLQPDLNRPRQPLEEYPLDALRLVGSINKPGQPLRALVKDPKGTIHTVRVGDRIGQNFGVITAITEDGLDIRELLQDASGEWTQSKAMMTLAD